MSAGLIHTAINELTTLCNTLLSVGSSIEVITRATKMARYDWRDLIQRDEATGTGLNTPFVVLRIGRATPQDWGLQNKAYLYPVDLILVHNSNNRLDATLQPGATGVNQNYSATTGIFVGQKHWFEGTDAWRTVTAFSGSGVTLDSSIVTSTGERVFSETVRDIEVRMEQLMDAIGWGDAFTSFQIVEEPDLDVSDMNYVNQIFLGANYPLLAGILSLKLLIGETYD